MTEAVLATTNYIHDEAFPIFPGNNRFERAMDILKHPKNIKKVAKDTYTVKSQFSFGTYVVTLGEKPTCTCPDYMSNGHICKHIIAVQAKVESYSHVWTDYNLSQTTEENGFSAYLKELTETIEEEERTTAGRPSIPLSEQVFCAVMKVYTNKSSRRSQGAINKANDEGFIEQSRHFNTASKLLNRADVTPILHELVRLSAAPMAEVEHDFAVDSSGFRTTSFGEWCDTKHGKTFTDKKGNVKKGRREHKWVKCHIAAGVLSNVISDVIITQSEGADTADAKNFLPLLDNTTGYFDVTTVSADKGYLSAENYAGAEKLGVEPFILFKKNSKLVKCQAWNNALRNLISKPSEWLETYNKRNNVESTFGALKAKFGEVLRSKNETAQINELLCKIIAYNITVVHEATISNLI